jgi:cytochrome c
VQGNPVHYGFGRTPTPGEIAALDIDVSPDGKGLPPGHGSVAEGAKIFAAACASCHGEKGELATLAGNALAGGIGTLASAKPVKTVGSYWPYSTILFDFVRRAMPFNAPQSLSADETYAVTAYVLALNGIIAQDAELNAQNLAAVKMPNREGFEAADWKAGQAVKP